MELPSLVDSRISRPTSVPQRQNALLVFVRVHFWKLFAVAGLATILYVSHTNAYRSPELPSKLYDDFHGNAKSYIEAAAGRDLSDGSKSSQMEQATVVLKNSATPVKGYLLQGDNDFVMLCNTYRNDPVEGETIIIPWANILYIQTKVKIEKKR